jgi:soluble lytic murein transglycosylase-like protein
MWHRSPTILAVLLSVAPRVACADVYTYVGSDSVQVLTNSRPQDGVAQVLVAEEVARVAAARPVHPIVAAKHARYDAMVEMAATAAGVDSALLHAVILVESGYSERARSVRGASGLMQLMPGTAREFGAFDVFDPVQNINGGARYLKYLLGKYDNRLDLALAAYNAGEKAMLKYGRKIPPFKETQRYVELVQSRYLVNQALQSNDHGLQVADAP